MTPWVDFVFAKTIGGYVSFAFTQQVAVHVHGEVIITSYVELHRSGGAFVEKKRVDLRFIVSQILSRTPLRLEMV